MKCYLPLSYRLYQCLSKQVSALEAKQDFCALETAFEKYFKIVFQYDSLPNRIISSMSGFQVLDNQELLPPAHGYGGFDLCFAHILTELVDKVN